MKENNMPKKDDMDFDFSDIAGSKEASITKPVKAKPAEEPKKKEKPKHTGILLTIPRPSRERKEWLSKDLAECTSEEFLEWIMYVFPFYEEDLTPEMFDTIPSRRRAVKEITQFHTVKLFTNKQEEPLIN